MRNPILTLVVLGLAVHFVSCTDPVRDAQIERLGGEDPRVSPGPEHRPGQPCVLCHSEGGPASDHKFAIAGTVFETSSPDSNGAEGVGVYFVDAFSAMRVATTNAAGNFYIPESEWSDLRYPFRVGLLKEGVNGNRPIEMVSVVNREASCNFCHRPNPGSPYALPGEDPRSSVGQIFLTNAGGTP